VRGELRPLTWERVDWERGLLTLAKYSTKNDDARAFPFREAPTVEAALERRLAYTRDVEARTARAVPYVFHVEGFALDVTAYGRFYAPWVEACKRAGFPDLNPHDFRRSAVRNLERSGVPRSVAKRLVGHRTDAMYDRYAIVAEDDLRAAVRRVHQPDRPEAQPEAADA
jgi:integrase